MTAPVRAATAVLAVALGACSEGAGMLTLTVDNLPPFVAETEILVAGGITRTPTKATDMIISISGGAASAADTVRGNRYEVRVRLTANAANQLSITATDATGSTSNTLNVTVRHDAQGPTITESTPADVSDNVALGSAVSLKFSEPVVIGPGGGLRLTRQGAAVPGSTTRSADSLTLTFTPTGGLSPNAIYRLGASGVSDVAQNAVPATAGTCFITTATGATATVSYNDSPGDTIYTGGTPNPNLLAPDIQSARFAREGALFSGIFTFSGPRIFSGTALNQGLMIVELDTDLDSNTGFWTIKDTLFYNSPSLGPTYSSGTRVEYILDLEPTPEVGDSAFAGRKSGAFSAFIDFVFLPSTCGAKLGFVVPFSILGNDDGRMNAVLLSVAALPATLLVDPMPTRGNLPVDVRAPTLAPAPGAAQFVAPSRTPREVRLPPRRIPLR